MKTDASQLSGTILSFSENNWADLDGFHTVGNIFDNPELLEDENEKTQR